VPNYDGTSIHFLDPRKPEPVFDIALDPNNVSLSPFFLKRRRRRQLEPALLSRTGFIIGIWLSTKTL